VTSGSRPAESTAHASAATRYGIESHLPLPKEERSGVALCLSGGGDRAALFHLGALRRLNELGVLSKVDTITCVSGASAIAAQLATHLVRLGEWPEPGQPVPDWDEGVAEPLRAFIQGDARTGPALRGFGAGWWDANTSTDALAALYAAGPASARMLDLPERPRFLFLATDMVFRTLWVFDTGKRVMGDVQAGYRPLTDEWTMARATAASNCLPGVFLPMQVHGRPEEFVGGTYHGPDRDELVASIDLSDGGVIDNLGVEPVWRDHSCLLVSDAGPCYKPDPKLGAMWKVLRFATTLVEQATDLRKRWLISRFLAGELEGAYWAIDGLPSRYGGERTMPVYSDPLIEDFVSQVRIDLDVFSDGEVAVLENHGYAMAELAMRTHAGGLVGDDVPPPRPPHPSWMDEEKAAQALAESSRTKLFARGFARRRSRWLAARRTVRR
jgi:NTE family protein